MDASQHRSPTVLVSWAHVDTPWTPEEVRDRREAVYALTSGLRRNGVDADVDLYHLSASVDWSRWGPQRVDACDFVLVVVSKSWRLAWEGTGDATSGAGAAAEADTLRSVYSRDRSTFLQKVRLVILPGSTQSEIPSGLHGVPRHRIESFDDDGLTELLRDLTMQPEYGRQDLGPLPQFAARPVAGHEKARPERNADSPEPSSSSAGVASASAGGRNALAKAREYLKFTAFSPEGLAGQLGFEGFAAKEIDYAVAQVDVDWQQQAARKAKDYLTNMPFSYVGLRTQLVSEGFSDEQAEGAVRALSTDWVQQAEAKAASYLSFDSFSKQRLTEQLEYDGFTRAEAKAAVDRVYE